MKKFKVTKKDGVQNEKGRNFIYTVPFLILIVLSLIGTKRACKFKWCVPQMVL